MNIKRYFLKISVLRFFFVYFRFLFFIYVKKNFKTLYNSKKKIDLFWFNQTETTIEHNSTYIKKSIFSDYSIVVPEFLGLRSNTLIYPILSLRHLKLNSMKVLCIGPRTEGEIYNLFIKGFNLDNIKAIDLQSYSPRIDIGDMHNIPYDKNLFDLIFCSWVLTYSFNKKKVVEEIVRTSKNGGLICVGLSSSSLDTDTDLKIKNSDDLISLFNDNIDKIYFRTNEDKLNLREDRSDTILVFKLKK
jgi:hypothetical protein